MQGCYKVYDVQGPEQASDSAWIRIIAVYAVRGGGIWIIVRRNIKVVWRVKGIGQNIGGVEVAREIYTVTRF